MFVLAFYFTNKPYIKPIFLMNYNGEHLLPGQLGHFSCYSSFTASLLATIAYFKASCLMESPENKVGFVLRL